MRAALARALARGGATAMLIPSDKPNRMLYTSAFGLYPGGPLPLLSVAKEDVLFLRRLLASGPVRLTLDVANTIDASPAQERNVVADIRGTTPGEVVLEPAAEVRAGPGANNATLFTVHQGLTVEIRAERDEWLQVSLPNGLSGWIERQATGEV